MNINETDVVWYVVYIKKLILVVFNEDISGINTVDLFSKGQAEVFSILAGCYCGPSN